MKHPSPEQLKPLINALDTFLWCRAVQRNKKNKGERCPVDVKSAELDLSEAYGVFCLILGEHNPKKATRHEK